MIAGTLEIELLANLARLQKDMDAAKGAVGDAMGSINKAVGIAKTALGAFGAAFTVTEIIRHTRAVIDAADAMNDMSQRVGIAVRDLAKYELATKQSGTTMEALAKGIKGLSGNLMENGDALKKAGISATTADGAMQQLADVFAAMPDGMEKTTLAVKLFGKSGMEMIPMLNLGSKGLQEAAEKSAKYAEQMALMAPMADAFNDNMATLAMTTKVMGMSMVNDALPGLVRISAAMADASVKGGTFQGILAGLSAGFENYKKNVRDFWGMEQPSTGGASGSWDAPKSKTSELDTWLEKYKALMAAMGGNADAKKALADANRELDAQTKLLAELSGLSGSFAQDWDRLGTMYAKGSISLDQLTAAQATLLEKQPAMQAAEKLRIELAKENTKAVDDLFEAQEKLRLANEDQIKTTRTMLEQIEFETRLLDLNAEQRAQATMERDLETKGIVKGTQAYDEYIAKLREAMAIKSGKEASITAAKDMADAQRKAAEESGKYWEDALMRAFERGGGFFQSFYDTIKNTLKTQVLKVGIQGVMGATGIGAMGTANAATGQAGGLLNSFGSLSSIGNALSGGYAGMLSTGVSSLFGATAGNAAMATALTGSASSAAAAAAAAAEAGGAAATTASAAASLGATIATALPWVAGAVALYSIFGSKGGGPKTESSYGNQAGLGDTSATGMAGSYALGIESAYNTLAKQLGLSSTLKVGAMVSADPQGTANTDFNATATVNGQQVYSRYDRMGGRNPSQTGRSDAELQAAMTEEMTRVLFSALKASDLPAQYKTYLDSVGGSVAEITAAMSNVTVVHSFTEALNTLPFKNLKDLSFDAAKGLIEVAGGLDNLQANLGTYYTNFYSVEEQRAQTIANINREVAGSGLDAATATRESFRALVEAQDLTTASGRSTYAALLSVSGAFASIADVADTAAKTFSDMLATIQKSLASTLDKITSERSAVAGAIAGLNPTSMSLAQIKAGIAGANIGMPGNSGVVSANALVNQADAYVNSQAAALASVKAAQATTLAVYDSGVQSSAAALDAAKKRVAAADLVINSPASDWDQNLYNGIAQGLAGIPRDIGAFIGDHIQNGRSMGYERFTAGNVQTAAQTAYNAQVAAYNTASATTGVQVANAQSLNNAAIAAQVAAQTAAKQAATDYAKAMLTYAGDAEKATAKLATLREETIKYYDAQKALAELMGTSAASLRMAVATARTGQLSSTQSLAQQQADYAKNYSLALSTSGGVQAAYADKLSAAIPVLATSLMDTASSRTEWALATAKVYAQAEKVASLIDSNVAAMDYQTETLATLGSIDATLAALEAGTNTAAGIISAAVTAGADLTAAGLRNVVTQLGGVPAFDVGTNYVPHDMLAMVHEGEAIVPKRYNTGAGSGVGGNTQRLEQLVQDLTAEVANLRIEARATASNTNKTAKILERVTPDGNSLQTVAA